MVQWLRDMAAVAGLCGKLLLHRRYFRILLLVLALGFTLLLGGLTEVSEEQSSIPVAIVVEEDGDAEQFAERVLALPALRGQRMGREEALEALREGSVQVVFLVEEGFGEKLRQGWKRELVTACYREGEESSRILSDMAAGELLEDLCLSRSFQKYQEEGGQAGWEEFVGQAVRWKELGEGEFLFDYEYWGGAAGGAGKPENKLIYLQVILGMLAVFLMLLTFLLYADSGKMGRMGSIPHSAALAGNALYQIWITWAVGFALFLVLLAKAGVLTASRLPATAVLLACFVLAESFVFLVLRELMGKQGTFFVLGGTVFCILSVLALVRVVNVFLPGAVAALSDFLPGGWFVREGVGLFS